MKKNEVEFTDNSMSIHMFLFTLTKLFNNYKKIIIILKRFD